MAKIQNIIFDIGNVLLRWDPPVIYTTLFGRTDFHKHPLSKIVGGKIWLDMDRGLVSLEEGIQRSVQGNEPYQEEIGRFFREAPYHFYPVTDTVAYARRLKEKGYKLFLLSNFHKYGYQILRKRFPLFDMFDGGVISWQVKVNKPERKIYDILLAQFNLLPEESVFIDDTEENILAARTFGIAGIHFSGAAALSEEMAEYL